MKDNIMYRDNATGEYPVSRSDIQTKYPNMSLPEVLSAGDIAYLNYGIVEPSDLPTFDQATQKVVEVAPIETTNGWKQAWSVVDLTTTELAALYNGARAKAKSDRAIAVDQIVVTTSTNKSFDGDETSQERMARAILVLQATNTPSTMWVLHDNTPTLATAAELVEALTLAGQEQSRLWLIP